MHGSSRRRRVGIILEIVVFTLAIRVPLPSDLARPLRLVVPREVANRLLELKETEASNESDSIGLLSAFPETNVSEPFMVAEVEEHSDEQLKAGEVVEHFVELVTGSEAVVKQLVEQPPL